MKDDRCRDCGGKIRKSQHPVGLRVSMGCGGCGRPRVMKGPLEMANLGPSLSEQWAKAKEAR